jgi:hypothetical protein
MGVFLISFRYSPIFYRELIDLQLFCAIFVMDATTLLRLRRGLIEN